MKAVARAFVVALLAALCAHAMATGAPGDENKACESQSPGGDFVQFSCTLTSRDPEQRWRFEANFAGGHDDTSASMVLTLDDEPLECEPGSKTRLFGEDGNVGLVCRFRLRRPAGAASVLGVALLWSHAQYVRTVLAVDTGS